MNLLNHWITASYPFYPWPEKKQNYPISVSTGSVNVKRSKKKFCKWSPFNIVHNSNQPCAKETKKKDASDPKRCIKRVFWGDKCTAEPIF